MASLIVGFFAPSPCPLRSTLGSLARPLGISSGRTELATRKQSCKTKGVRKVGNWTRMGSFGGAEEKGGISGQRMPLIRLNRTIRKSKKGNIYYFCHDVSWTNESRSTWLMFYKSSLVTTSVTFAVILGNDEEGISPENSVILDDTQEEAILPRSGEFVLGFRFDEVRYRAFKPEWRVE